MCIRTPRITRPEYSFKKLKFLSLLMFKAHKANEEIKHRENIMVVKILEMEKKMFLP
jgi:hypothetical protein